MSLFSLSVRDLSKAYGDRRVLDAASLTASPGQRIGLVGENGAGKTTFLRLIAGVEQADDGGIQRPDDVGFLHQELPFDEDSVVGDVLENALIEIREALRRLDELAKYMQHDPSDEDAAAEYGEVLEWAQFHQAWHADRRAELVLAGLGLDELRRDRELATLSGGQQSRLGLAALLIRQPSALLLDEPSNHLDDDAVLFLETHLRQLPGVVVLASHDRVLLDEVCTHIVDLDPTRTGISRYGGAYRDYLVEKRAERARWQQQYEKEQDELVRLRHSVDVTARQVSHNRERGNNSKLAYDYAGGRVQKQISRRVRNARQRFDELTENQVRKPPAPLRFSAPLTGKSGAGEAAISLREVWVPARLWVPCLDLAGDARILITGANGAGKSTLLSVLAGRITPDSGTVSNLDGMRVSLLEQDVTFPDMWLTPRSLYGVAAGENSLPLSELGLLPARDLDRPVGVLSVGGRRRVALACLLADPPQVLLLDEPTNHISLQLAEELEQALGTAAGAVAVASHDRWLRRRWEGETLHLVDGRIAS